MVLNSKIKENKTMITLDEIDRDYIKDVLIKCQAILKMRMTDTKVCQSNREMSREYAKMTQFAIDILNGKSEISA